MLTFFSLLYMINNILYLLLRLFVFIPYIGGVSYSYFFPRFSFLHLYSYLFYMPLYLSNNPYIFLLWPAPSSIFLYYYLLNYRLILGYYISSLFLRSNNFNKFSLFFPAIFTISKFPFIYSFFILSNLVTPHNHLSIFICITHS